MTNELRVTLEVGPKGKKVVAIAPDWPGLSRGAATEQAALARLCAYLPRYAPVAALAGMAAAFAPQTEPDIVERYPGSSSTDFWGISFAFSSSDQRPMSVDELERELMLMQACWVFFDDVRGRVSSEMQKGPRGGGRDRDQIVRHTLFAECQMAEAVGVRTTASTLFTDDGLKGHREAYCAAIREYHAQGRLSGIRAKRPLRYLIRHTAYHSLDHSWEMEDKHIPDLADSR